MAFEYDNKALLRFNENLEDFIQEIIKKDNNGDFVNPDIIKILANFDDLRDTLNSDYNVYSLLDTKLFVQPKPPAPVEDDNIRLIVSFLQARKSGRSNIHQFTIDFFTDIWVHNSNWFITGHNGKRYSRNILLSSLVHNVVMNSSTISVRGKPTIKTPPFTYDPSSDYMGYRAVYSVTN